MRYTKKIFVLFLAAMTVLQCLPAGTLAETADQGETVQENAEEPFGKDVITDEKRGQKQHSEVTVESVVGAYRTDAKAAGTLQDTRAESTGTDLADFLIRLEVDAPVDENGNYVIDPNRFYDMTFTFRENEGLQFDNEAELVYELPAGLIVPDTAATSFEINIVDGQGSAVISGCTFEVADGKLIVHFNQDDPNIERLYALGNVTFNIGLSVKIDENISSIVFNPDIEKDFVFEIQSDLNIDKAVDYHLDTDTAEYTITIVSDGYNENVFVQDILNGTALILNHDVTVTSSISGTLNPEVNYSDNGFSFTLAETQDQEIITIHCSASVDNTKISSNGTVEQTNNTARVTSDQVPDGKEASANFAGQADFQRVAKRPVGEPVQISENLYEQTWKIRVNEDHKMEMGGASIYDWITTNSRPFMHFTGDGLTVNVTFENGAAETRIVPWSDLYLYQSSEGIYGWNYLTPESDGKASYIVTCKTLINTENAITDLTLVNGAQVYNSYDEGQTKVTGIGENVFSIKKEAITTTSKESEWQLTVTVPAGGLPQLRVVDDVPRLTYNGITYLDYYLEDSMEIDGLLEGETWEIRFTSDRRNFTVHFFKNGAEGVLPSEDGAPREIVIRFKTEVNQEWLNLASEDKYQNSTLYRHVNAASARSFDNRTPTSSDVVVPVKPTLVKTYLERTSAEIDGVTYPVFKYLLDISGPTADGIVIHDSFDTKYLKFYEGDGIVVQGGDSTRPSDTAGASAHASETAEGVDITIDTFPKNTDGAFYRYYKVRYSLIVKDSETLKALNEAAALSQTGVDLRNVARWDDLEAGDAVHYTSFPYVDKEVVTAASPDNDYIAEFKVIINRDADDLNPLSDTLDIQDVLSSNLRFVQGSVSISPANENIKVQFDSSTNTLIFADVPDNTRYEVTYNARVLGKGNVTYSNTVKLGQYEKTVEESVSVVSTGGGTGSNPSITLVKRDSENVSSALSGAVFALYYLNGDTQVPVTDKEGNQVTFKTGADGAVLISGSQALLGWTLWEGRTYQLVELTAPSGYQLNEEPAQFVLSDSPSSQLEYDLIGDTLTVYNTRMKTAVSVEKQWIGPAAESAQMTLTANGQPLQTVTLNADNGWTHTFENLDMYDEYLNEIKYDIEEESISGYRSEKQKIDEQTYVITNTNIETIQIPVRKEWTGISEREVTMYLTADNEMINELILNEANNWAGSFDTLPKYDKTDGHEILYDVIEEELPEYTSEKNGSVQEGFVFTNMHVPGVTEIRGQKTWDDNDDQDGIRPENITIHLFAGDVEIDQKTVSADDQWTYSFTDLPQYENGIEIEYSIKEDDVNGYTAEYQGFNITNIHIPEKTNIPVSKYWDDNENQDGIRPYSVTFTLMKNGEMTDQTITLNEGVHWQGVFEDLDVYENGSAIVYNVAEERMDGYTCDTVINDSGAIVVFNTHIPETIQITGQKTWDDSDNQDGVRPESITVRLYADGIETAVRTVTAEDEWSYTFTDLPKYDSGREIVYLIMEDEVTDYTPEYDGYDIVNTHTPGKTSVTVIKTWNDNDNQDGIRPDSINVVLTADGEPTDISLQLDESTKWTGTFTDLDEKKDGRTIIYGVQEMDIEGYICTVDGTAETGFILTNTHEPEVTEISGQKTWDDNDNQDGIRPESITVRLFADGTEAALKIVSAEDEWTYEFKNLPRYNAGTEIVYTVAEDEVNGYLTEYEGFDMKNTHAPEKTKITVMKAWNDNGDQDGKRPAEMTFTLLKNGDRTDQTIVLNDGNGWIGTFENLDVYEYGNQIIYDVEEELIFGDSYVCEKHNEEPGVYLFINSHEPELTEVSGKKTWVDNDNQDGVRPEQITIRLYADGKEIAEKHVTGTDNWVWKFDNLPKYADGKEIIYSITEDAIPDYTAEYFGYDIRNVHTPGKTGIPVTKVWDDMNNKDGIRPDRISVHLYADGKNTGKTLILNRVNGWKDTFTDLDIYKNGKEVIYTVVEDTVRKYTTTITGDQYKGYTIKNTYIPGTPKTGDNDISIHLKLLAGALLLFGAALLVRKKYLK